MSDILRVTTPLPGQDGSGRIRPGTPQEVNVQNIPDPKRVTQPNSQNVFSEKDQSGMLPNFESNYEKYLQLLRSAGESVVLYEELFFSKTGYLVSSAMGEGMAAEFAEFMELLQMNQAGLTEFVRNQLEGAVKFQGPLFRMLNEIYQNSRSEDVKLAILTMLQRFDSMTSSAHILSMLKTNLEAIAGRLPDKFAVRLREMADSLAEHPNGRNAANLNIIKNDIIPFLSRYISQRHDYGPIRELTALFTLGLARYEGGSEEGFLESLRLLLGYDEVSSRFTGIDRAELENLFVNLPLRGADSQLIESFVDVISRGIAGEAGALAKPAFENLLQSMLVNQSVYMPLIHAVIPANVEGSMFFSEMWIDPDAENSGEKREKSGPRAIKALIKFDIKNVGYFEIIILSKEGSVDLKLYYPSRFEEERDYIRHSITEIIRRNLLSLSSFELEEARVPKTISEVFPKVYERKNVINVVV